MCSQICMRLSCNPVEPLPNNRELTVLFLTKPIWVLCICQWWIEFLWITTANKLMIIGCKLFFCYSALLMFHCWTGSFCRKLRALIFVVMFVFVLKTIFLMVKYRSYHSTYFCKYLVINYYLLFSLHFCLLYLKFIYNVQVF